jgi:3-hydroxybutyryl-CoA dehydrogenase
MHMEIKRVGIVGAGQMGSGIAQVCATAGLDVLLNDRDPARLENGLTVIEGSLARLVSKGTLTEGDSGEARARIVPARDFAALEPCDLVIEAATENEATKREIFSTLCGSLRPETLVATNTSSISITRLAAATDRPEKFIGIHFMNPVPLMQLVELIRGIATEDARPTKSVQGVRRQARQARSPISEDFPAFIVNRILLPMINEAIYTLYEGVGNGRGHRCRDEARRPPPDGPAAAGRFHRPRHLPVGHAGAARGAGRFQVPALPAAGEVCRSRLARPEGASAASTITAARRRSRRAERAGRGTARGRPASAHFAAPPFAPGWAGCG